MRNFLLSSGKLFTGKFGMSSSPQRDGYELNNLIEQKNQDVDFIKKLKSNAFVSDTFVRAPVSIQIIFNEPVNIEKIVLDGKVNIQKSNGFVISSSIESISTFESDKSRFDKSFCQIAKITNDKNPQISVYEFVKRGKEQEQVNQNVNRCFFNTKSLKYLSEVTALQITITRTVSSSSPCLNSVKVFGKLVSTKNLGKDSHEKESVQKQDKKVKVPEDFIDALTSEMMRMPVKLPSNKYIDQ